MSLEKRGLLATLEALGDEVCMRKPELDALMGEGWTAPAMELRTLGMIALEYVDGFYVMKLRYRDRKRREKMKRWKDRRNRRRQRRQEPTVAGGMDAAAPERKEDGREGGAE